MSDEMSHPHDARCELFVFVEDVLQRLFLLGAATEPTQSSAYPKDAVLSLYYPQEAQQPGILLCFNGKRCG